MQRRNERSSDLGSARLQFASQAGKRLRVRSPQFRMPRTDRLETPKQWRTLPEVLSVDEVTRLLEAPTLDDPLVFRDRAMLELAYAAGLRVSEWIGLEVKDVLFEEQLVRVFGAMSGRAACGPAPESRTASNRGKPRSRACRLILSGRPKASARLVPGNAAR